MPRRGSESGHTRVGGCPLPASPQAAFGNCASGTDIPRATSQRRAGGGKPSWLESIDLHCGAHLADEFRS